MPGTIKFFGSLALLISGLTGPAVAVIPLLYQQAGWLTPLVMMFLVTILTGSAALFLVEAMSSIEGNEAFQASIEYTTIAELFLGRRWHWFVQIVLYVALQSLTVTSLIESFQSMDALIIEIFHKTCAVSFQKGWECVSIPSGNSSPFSDYIFVSFGFLVTLALVLPLSLVHLTDNIKFQIASLLTLFFIAAVWIVTFFEVGIDNQHVSVVGPNQGTLVGFVLSNFAVVTTIPAWVNNVHPSVNLRLAVWLSLGVSCILYIVIGWTGASAFTITNDSTILNVLTSARPSKVALVSTYLFPLAVLISSIPVFAIVVRYNLLRGDICSKPWAMFWSSIVPWFIVIPFQTNGWITIILNWASLVFSSSANLIVPFLLYVVSKRYRASAILGSQADVDEFNLRPLDPSDGEAMMADLPASPSRRTSRSTMRPRSQAGSVRSHIAAPEPSHDHSSAPGCAIVPSTPIDDKEEEVDEDTPYVASFMSTPTKTGIVRQVRSPSIHRHYGERPTHRRNSEGGLIPLDDTGADDGGAQEVEPKLPTVDRGAERLSPSPVNRGTGRLSPAPVGRDGSSEARHSDRQLAGDDLEEQPSAAAFTLTIEPASEQETDDDPSVGDQPLSQAETSASGLAVPPLKVEQVEATSSSLGPMAPYATSSQSEAGERLRRRSISFQEIDTSESRPPPRSSGEHGATDLHRVVSTPSRSTSVRSRLDRLSSSVRSVGRGSAMSSHHRTLFKAFPFLSRSEYVRPTWVAIVECGVTTAIIVATIVYNIVQSIKEKTGQTASP